jgi:hypothetical protein
MPLRCPLCLKTLGPETQFIRFCRTHPDASATFSPHQQFEIFCPADECKPPNLPPPMHFGVFLLHRGCVCTNPFWSTAEQKVVVPGKVQLGTPATEVKHWIIALLREASAQHPDVREMWFPQVLFQATNYEDREKTAALVMMAGAQKSGKTILSTMAIAPRNYNNDFESKSFDYTVDDFVHITPGFGVQQSDELLRVLQVLDDMRQFRTTQDPPPATEQENISNIKSAVFNASQATIANLQRDTFRSYWQKIFLQLFAMDSRKPGPSRRPVTGRVIAFYDMAGERFELAFDPAVFSLNRSVDILAVLLDASAITTLKASTDESARQAAWVASACLKNRYGSRSGYDHARRCVIVTKLDLIPVSYSQDAGGLWKFLEAIRQGKALGVQDSARELLLRWLKNGDEAERALHHEIAKDTALPVFFVWTEGLGDKTKLAKTHGLIQFVEWCWDPASAAEVARRAVNS